MANVLLGVTGSVAAILTNDLFTLLQAAGHDVRVVATEASLYFFKPELIGAASGERDATLVTLDEDEWPGKSTGRLYQRADDVLHIELRRWADVFVIAPLDANTLAKIAYGLADNCLTCVWRAWDRTKPLVLAPAMNTMMWEHPATARHLRQLAADSGAGELPRHCATLDLIERINAECRLLTIVPPQVKTLACQDVGIGAMASVDLIVDAVQRMT